MSLREGQVCEFLLLLVFTSNFAWSFRVLSERLLVLVWIFAHGISTWTAGASEYYYHLDRLKNTTGMTLLTSSTTSWASSPRVRVCNLVYESVINDHWLQREVVWRTWLRPRSHIDFWGWSPKWYVFCHNLRVTCELLWSSSGKTIFSIISSMLSKLNLLYIVIVFSCELPEHLLKTLFCHVTCHNRGLQCFCPQDHSA